jgi:hypothetical protein
MFQWTGQGEQHMYSNEKSIGLGGSHIKGRFGLFLSGDLYKGSSVECDSYQNEVLSGKSDFKCCHLEVWALED